MKHPVYWFLISSGLIASTSLSLAQAVTEVLNSSDSYDGNGTFTPKTTTHTTSTTYSCEGNVCIANAGDGTALSSSCFTQSAGDLIFVGNGYSLCFDHINAGNNPAAVNVSAANKTLSVTGFSIFSCSFCPPGITGQGAIKSTGTTTFDNDSKLLFQKNCSTENGGAITCKGFNLKNTSNSAEFTNNLSQKHGGAVYSNATTTISNNNLVTFIGNTTTGTSDSSGGAIYCSDTTTPPDLKLEGNQQLVFSENSSKVSGGAIYANKLTINSGGLTKFSNNSVTHASAPKGGAICLADTNSECSLTADLGNIIFDGNKIITTTGTASTKRNAIDLGTGGKFMKLDAKEGFGIFFYDPIANNGDTASTIEINKTAGTTTYSGQIVFSGEKLTDEERKVADNLKSTFKQAVKIGSGSLVLKDGTTVEAKSLEQTGGSVVMDLGTTLKASSTGGEDITLTNLVINTASLGGGGGTLSPAQISADATNKSVTIQSINLVDSNGNGYEYPIFSTTQPFSAIEAKANGTGTATIPTTNLTNYVPPAHYGYQGNWTTTWQQGGTAATQTATLNWKQTGYNPNPERQGPLVPNTLWGAFSDVRAMQNLMNISVDGANYQRGFWVAGLANFLHKSGTETKRKFRHNSAGYLLGAFAQTPSEDIFSAAFCQLFGKDKDYLVAKNSSNIYAGSIYYQHTSFWSAWDKLLQNTIGAQAPLVLNAQLTYSHASNDMKTNMTTTYAPPNVVYPEIKGDWGNDCFGVELGAVVPIDSQYSSLFDMYAPFLKLQLVHAHQEDFKENNSSEGRYFESSNLMNLSMPIGVKFERFSANDSASYNLILAYSPDIARSNPDCTTSLLVSPTTAVWTTKASNLARQAFLVRAGNYLSFSQNFEVFSQFSFELRGSSKTYNIDLGSKIQF
ncbi:Polymorphic membrane protein F,chlamydial polymorphic outer membrane protein repeat,Autotransporter beta-domain [Chlamydia poikilotherma]|uniref:Polymorphic membrane protein F,chlamydial polymorphic outer membrane protein repeat,Autotransporter beta-domain n=1 Tax=Chlamydia poikilotherma TaxID=1967783 RepID=A0A3B0QH11_9CHLA|nr:polymorphic outer membrane protein middle domain-containing protein [Chlamydia poikilotherma]SYX09092.1 Polymorphic membrane protein F,chlamydial polymorphic outer membrane protein repeat,Autotransporter beta-domain [Chlamydia poikilotherma]